MTKSNAEIFQKARRASYASGLLAVALFYFTSAQAQDSAQPAVPAAQPAATNQPTPPPQSSTPADPNAPAKPADQSSDTGMFVFKAHAEEVVLHLTVVDAENRLITGLDKSAFTVYEDGKPQTVRSFRSEDVPVALGIVIDNSGSMRTMRPSVNRAAIELVKASNPRDGVFIVNFGEDSYLDQDFTSDVSKLQQALAKIDTRGTTAIYDALVASANHLERNVRTDKKILLLITDGADNASRQSLKEALQRLQQKDGPIIYVIAMLGGAQPEAHSALDALSRETGGTAFFPMTPQEVDTISQTLAHDIRSQYTITYSPSTDRTQGKYHSIQVVANKPAERLQVRTRTGYYGGEDFGQPSDSPITVAPAAAPPTQNNN